MRPSRSPPLRAAPAESLRRCRPRLTRREQRVVACRSRARGERDRRHLPVSQSTANSTSRTPSRAAVACRGRLFRRSTASRRAVVFLGDDKSDRAGRMVLERERPFSRARIFRSSAEGCGRRSCTCARHSRSAVGQPRGVAADLYASDGQAHRVRPICAGSSACPRTISVLADRLRSAALGEREPTLSRRA